MSMIRNARNRWRKWKRSNGWQVFWAVLTALVVVETVKYFLPVLMG